METSGQERPLEQIGKRGGGDRSERGRGTGGSGGGTVTCHHQYVVDRSLHPLEENHSTGSWTLLMKRG